MRKRKLLLVVFFITLICISAFVQGATRNIAKTYHTSDEIITSLKQMTRDHPTLMSYEIIGKSLGGKDIYLFKIGNPNGGKFMFDGRVHGPEDCGTENGIQFIKWVLDSNDADAVRVRERNYLLFIPIINIDTTERQNMRRSYTYQNGTTISIPYGVDLNRNFPTNWGASGSSDPLNDYEYRGPYAGSEPETQAVVNAMKKYNPNIYLNVHCGMQMLGYKTKNDVTLKVISLINSISASTGANTPKLYPPGPSCAGGFVCNDGAYWSDGNGWLYETSTWDQMPDTLDGYLQKWYPQAFPIYLAMSQAVEKVTDPAPLPYCGDKSCNGNENCSTCSADCGTCPVIPVCGDKVCNGKENCTTCSSDCGTCPVPQNHAPTQTWPWLRASDYPNNTTNANLTCYNQSTKDADGDKVVNIYRWFRNSTYLPAFTNLTKVHYSFTQAGETWVCEVTPYDGKAYGTAMNSSALLIRAVPFCGDKVCNGKENCTTCSSDCGACSTKITACTLEDHSWDEDTMLKKAYNLTSCFKDPLKTALTFKAVGNQNINVVITNGVVDLISPPDWNGAEQVTFYAYSGSRSAKTNTVTLTVWPASDCGDSSCDSDESCDTCPSDCGECTRSTSSGGGGGGGGGSTTFSQSTNVLSSENKESNDTMNSTATEIKNQTNAITPISSNNPPVKEEPAVQTADLTEEKNNPPDNTIEELPAKLAVKEPEMQATANAVASSSTRTPWFILPLLIFVIIGVMTISPGAVSFINTKVKKKAYYIDDSPSSSYPLSLAEQYSYPELDEYVASATKHGHTKQMVESNLLSVGWSQEIVKSTMKKYEKEFVINALKNSGLGYEHSEALYYYLKKALNNGYTVEMIVRELLNVGWTPDILRSLLSANATDE